jgi:pyruvate formate-lyase activating enzyme-like uncharacterized protein
MAGGMPRGCESCLRGAKLVLFVTGECESACYYCPLSERRKGLNVVYADEVPVETDLDIILEGRAIDAEGTGITGGDPLIRLPRTLKFIKLLKGFFGPDHHIPLYTNGRLASRQALARLKTAGLDEIRFHPARRDWGRVAEAKALGMYAGAEVPAIPSGAGEVEEFIRYLSSVKADFININQLEFCPQNAFQLRQRGFRVMGGSMAAAEGSEEAAMEVVRWAEAEGIGFPVHYCPSSVKDAVQTRGRLARRAANAARPWEERLEDGTVGKFVVGLPGATGRPAKCILARAVGADASQVGVADDGRGVEVPRRMVDAVRIAFPDATVSYVQAYPTAARDKFAEFPC